jgi:hypothetical protein
VLTLQLASKEGGWICWIWRERILSPGLAEVLSIVSVAELMVRALSFERNAFSQ